MREGSAPTSDLAWRARGWLASSGSTSARDTSGPLSATLAASSPPPWKFTSAEVSSSMRAITASSSRDEGAERIVIGLPVHTSGREGELARMARDFGRWLQSETGLAVVFTDERYSSREADEALRATQMNAKGRKARRDMLAAQILLQAYLDAGCPMDQAPYLPLDDREPPA